MQNKVAKGKSEHLINGNKSYTVALQPAKKGQEEEKTKRIEALNKLRSYRPW